jgi:hypothetical protein
MVANIESRKVNLIAFIASLQQEEVVSAFENIVQQFKPKKNYNTQQEISTVSEADIQYFKRPIRENITVDDLVFEQKWQPINEKKMDEIVKRLGITEPIEDLLAQLNA